MNPRRARHLYLLGTPVYDNEADARRRIREMSRVAALPADLPADLLTIEGDHQGCVERAGQIMALLEQ